MLTISMPSSSCPQNKKYMTITGNNKFEEILFQNYSLNNYISFDSVNTKDNFYKK